MEIGRIDFFGYGGLDIHTLPARLPIQVGDSVTFGDIDQKRVEIQRVIQNTIGHPPTDVAAVCCNSANHLLIYIGLDGTSSRPMPSVAAIHGSEHLDPIAKGLYEQFDDALEKAVRRGVGGEDWSRGYALSVDPAAREIQLKVRAYAMDRGAEIEKVLQHSGDAQQRSISAYFLGYAKRSTTQIQALIKAASDNNEEVRNNAVRALVVLSSATSAEPLKFDPQPLIDLVFSGKWTDRNKASLLLSNLTKQRDPTLLQQLRQNALQPLIEGAKWESPGHSAAFLFILGRIGGLSDDDIGNFIKVGDKEKIIQAAVLGQ